ncbi:MAG: tRNA (N(6)-L-threonylcarbamoyladenosine(37)-C(2))-methylthiotransferase [Candidatus Micrarchaeota archaeon]|nr:tRNA (N(6)-L-threonylcarbamoyladenosine(37)-C(2))-methylthiotransferase [Candidatus Micrarchaeota archaeon]
MRIHIKTYGCTLNQADSDIIASLLDDGTNELTGSAHDPDVVVVNTCTVKRATSQKILYELGKLQEAGKRVVVTGCMAGANQDLIKKYAPGASIVTTSNIPEMQQAVSATNSGQQVMLTKYRKDDRLAYYNPNGSKVARIAVSDGCLSSCSFCETKFARGPLNSFEERRILDAIRYSVARGAKEIQLTSQDMGAYGLDRKTNIAELMSKITDIEGDFRVRVGMLNPEHLHRYFDGFAEALQSEKFYKFMHLPVQSGSDRVLSDMRRACTTAEFEAFVLELRKRIPESTIETDIIVGYPTETDSDFELTLDMIKRLKPDVTNISKFGARPHADASKLAQHPQGIINSRSLMLSRVVRSVQHELNDRHVGRHMPITITEDTEKSYNGRSLSYKQVVIRKVPYNGKIELGSTQNVVITNASANVLYGSIE